MKDVLRVSGVADIGMAWAVVSNLPCSMYTFIGIGPQVVINTGSADMNSFFGKGP